MYLDPAWLPGDDFTVPQATYETCARNARTLLDRLKVGKSATCATPRHATPRHAVNPTTRETQQEFI
jgi:hypothetical protein